jgi:hypothetical protein
LAARRRPELRSGKAAPASSQKEPVMLTAHCPGCRHAYEVPESLAGQATLCTECGERFKVRSPEMAVTKKGPEPASPEPPPRKRKAKARWLYKMVQAPATLTPVKGDQGRAATYLEELVNKHAAKGWEFFRVDEIGISIPPGVFAMLFGEDVRMRRYFIVTFRKSAD